MAFRRLYRSISNFPSFLQWKNGKKYPLKKFKWRIPFFRATLQIAQVLPVVVA